MPVYLALDMSLAAERFSPYYWSGLSQLSAELAHRPELAALTSIAVGVLDDDCRWTESLPPAQISMHQRATTTRGVRYPALERMAETVRALIDSDVATFRAANRHCCRPALIVLVASAGPIERWRAAVGSLTRYDYASGSGNPHYPVVLPVGFGEDSDAGLAELVHPPGASQLMMLRDTSDAMSCVRAAFEVIGSFVVESVRTLAAGEFRHVYPRPEGYPAGQAPARRDEADAITHLRLLAELPEQAPPSGTASYVPIRCQRNGVTMVAEFRQREAGWQLLSATPVVAESPAPATKTLTGAFDVSPSYRGCTGCGDRGITLCRCGQLGCWDGAQSRVRCASCGTTATIMGNITRLQSVE